MANDQNEQPKPKRGRPKGAKNKKPPVANGKWLAKKLATKGAAQPRPPKTSKVGKPRKELDLDRVRELAEQGLPQQYIANLIGCSITTLKASAAHVLEAGYAAACDRINAMTWAAAPDNPSVLLHLRKVLLGENDKLELVGKTEKYVLVIDSAENE